MIPLPEDWLTGGQFVSGWLEGWFGTSIEHQRHGTLPVFFPIIYPFYFATGVAAGSGTFVNVNFAAPDRLEVAAGATGALYTSPVLAGRGNFPAVLTPTWEINSPGYTTSLEYRTAATSGACEAASWSPLVNGETVNVQRYYQWRVSWMGARCWFFEHEADMDDTAFWFLQTYDPGDPYQSYFTEDEGTVAYLQGMSFAGEYEVPQDDIKDRGSCIDESAQEFGSLAAGDLTLVLVNRDNLYNPDADEFLMSGDNYWYKKGLRIEMAYQTVGGQFTASRIPIWAGEIDDWGPVPHRVDQAGKFEEHTVTVVARDLLAVLADIPLGAQNEDGTPNPFVCGEILHQLEQVGDESLGEPDRKATFENGGFAELSGVDIGGDGLVEMDTADPYEGAYSLRTAVNGANAYAKCRLDLAIASSQVLFITQLKFATMPAAPADKHMHFLGLYDAGGNERLQLFVGADFRVWAYAAGQWKETDWYINQDPGVYKRVSTGVLGANPGTLKIWVNGNEVLTWDADWSAMSLKGGFLGPHNGAVAEGWEIVSGAWEIYPNYWPQLFMAAGGPYEAIGTVYVDGAVKVGTEPAQIRRGLRTEAPGLTVRFVGGTTQSANLEKYPDYGAVAFTDYSSQVGGTVMAYFRRNGITHWADIVQAILMAVGKADLINLESIAAAKAATPGDSLGVYFENTTVGDALKALATAGLFTLFRSQNQIKIKAYTGEAPAVYDLELDEWEFVGGDPKTDMKGIKNKVVGTYGWYERNHRLSQKSTDEESIRRLGVLDRRIDYSWGGGPVGSDNGGMVRQKVEWLKTRLRAGCRDIEVNSSLRLVRLEPEDVIRLNIPYYGTPKLWRVAKKTIRQEPPYGVDLGLVRYLGEE